MTHFKTFHFMHPNTFPLIMLSCARIPVLNCGILNKSWWRIRLEQEEEDDVRNNHSIQMLITILTEFSSKY